MAAAAPVVPFVLQQPTVWCNPSINVTVCVLCGEFIEKENFLMIYSELLFCNDNECSVADSAGHPPAEASFGRRSLSFGAIPVAADPRNFDAITRNSTQQHWRCYLWKVAIWATCRWM